MFVEEIVPFVAGHFTERKVLLAFKMCTTELLGPSQVLNQFGSFSFKVSFVCNNKVWRSRRILRINFRAGNNFLKKGFKKKFLDCSRWFELFRLVGVGIGYITVGKHLCCIHLTPLWLCVFPKLLNSSDYFLRNDGCENVFDHGLRFAPKIEIFAAVSKGCRVSGDVFNRYLCVLL